jgi:hypothetical protein
MLTPDDLPALAAFGVEAHEWHRAEASLERARALQQPLRLAEALAELGRCARRSGDAEQAAQRFDEALRWARSLPVPDLLADLLCERGEMAADQVPAARSPDAERDPDAWLHARACAAEAAALAPSTSDPAWEVYLLLRASDLFNRLDCANEAVALQVRAMQRQTGGADADAAAHAAVELQPHATLQ